MLWYSRSIDGPLQVKQINRFFVLLKYILNLTTQLFHNLINVDKKGTQEKKQEKGNLRKDEEKGWLYL